MPNISTAEKLIEPSMELEIPLPPTDLPLEDGIPLETNQHRIAMNVLIQSLKHAWAERTDFFVGGNMFVYFSTLQLRNKDYRGPDFFVALDIDGSYSRQSWTVWEEGGKYPDVIVELLSSSTKAEDLGNKKNLYERIFKTPNYFVFDPFDAKSLRGWHFKNRRYEELVPNEQGRIWSEELQLWLGVWEGTVERESGKWLRFYDTARQLVLLPEEAERQQRELAEQRVAQLTERLRTLGINPDS